MIWLLSDNRIPLKFSSAGNLINGDGFLHGDRCLDTFVLLVGVEGILNIAQGNQFYQLKPGEYLLLFPRHRHYGYQQSEGMLSYYWCHFELTDPCGRLTDEAEVSAFLREQEKRAATSWDWLILKEYGRLAHPERIDLAFRRLIDASRHGVYSQSMLDYAISALTMEITRMFLSESRPRDKLVKHPNIAQIQKYVRENLRGDLRVQSLAERFCYHPNYLSTLFRQQTGESLLRYINRVRLDAAKELLLNSSNTIVFISQQVGFRSEKHFMKLFRLAEKTTPTRYRNAYAGRYVNQI